MSNSRGIGIKNRTFLPPEPSSAVTPLKFCDMAMGLYNVIILIVVNCQVSTITIAMEYITIHLPIIS